MCAEIRRAIALLCIVPVLATPLRAQEEDSLYALTAFGGIGYTRNMSTFDIIPGLGLEPDRNGFGGFLRVMWKPEHLLRVGLETGITKVYSVSGKNIQTPYGQTNFGSYLSVVPVSLIFSMPLISHLEGYISSTSYFLFSKTWSFGSTTTGSMISVGFSGALAYMWPVNHDVQIGCEIKWYHIEKSNDDNILIQIVVGYRFLEW